MFRRHALVLALLPLVLVDAAPAVRAIASPATEMPKSCPESVAGSPDESSGIMDAAIAWWRSLGTKEKTPAPHKSDDAIVCEVLEGGKTRCVPVAERCRPTGSLPDSKPNVPM